MFPHYPTSPETLAYSSIALHSPRGCKATTACKLQSQFCQDCHHCTGERREKKSKSPGEEGTATFSRLLPGDFPPPCLFCVISIEDGKTFGDNTLCPSFQRRNFMAIPSLYNFRQALLNTAAPMLRFSVRACPNLSVS